MSTPGYLVAEDVSVRLGSHQAVAGVSFALPRHGLIALVGPNGAGKTTLLRALCGLVPSSGTIRVGDENVAALPIRERARRFAYLPQGQTVHWPLAVRDVVALGRYPHGAVDPARLPARDAAAVERAMQATGVDALAARRVTELSGGERSRVTIARVLAVEAPVILADEPFASLDPRYQLDIMALLRGGADAGALVVVVTHDLGLAARFSDHVLVLQQGRLAAAGAPAEALTPELLANVFRVKAFRTTHDGDTVIIPWTGT